MLKNIFALSIALIFTTMLLTGCGESPQGEREEFVHIATGNTSGTYYPIGGAMSEILNADIAKMHSSVQTTSGSVSNLKLLQEGTVELAIVQNDIAHYALNGLEMFKDENKHKFENLRGIAALYPETCQIVVLESSGINSISDLRGKKVAVGAEGSGVEINARQILSAYDITYDSIDAQFLSFSAASKALNEGRIDAAFLTAGTPTAAVEDVASQHKIHLLSIDDEHVAILTSKYPFYTKTTLAKGTYAGLENDVQTVSVMALLVCNDRVNDDLGYQITKTLFTHLDNLKEAHSAISHLEKSKVNEGMTLEVNGGAKKFFAE